MAWATRPPVWAGRGGGGGADTRQGTRDGDHLGPCPTPRAAARPAETDGRLASADPEDESGQPERQHEQEEVGPHVEEADRRSGQRQREPGRDRLLPVAITTAAVPDGEGHDRDGVAQTEPRIVRVTVRQGPGHDHPPDAVAIVRRAMDILAGA